MADKYDSDDYVSDLEKRIQAKAAPIQEVPQAALQSLQNKIQGTGQPGNGSAGNQPPQGQHLTYPDKYDQVRKQAVLEAMQSLRQQSQQAQPQLPQQMPAPQQLPTAPIQQEEPETNESPEVSNAKSAIARGNYGNPYEFQKLQQIISGKKDDE